ncbi:hypothetical protein Tco_0122695 [Tanacetum coccineum]
MTMEILPEPTSNKLCSRRTGNENGYAAVKPCQGDSLEFYLITCSIYTDQRGTVVIPMVAAAGSRQVKIHSHMLILDPTYVKDIIESSRHVLKDFRYS